VQLKIWALQMRHPIEKCRRFIRRIALKEEIARLETQHRIIYRGEKHLPEIALTFDDGPDPYYTPQVLDILEQYGVNATFFCLGRQVVAYPNIVKQAYKAGHVIGNHTWTHPDLAVLSAAEILSQLNCTSHAIQEITGVRPAFFRPPYGVFNKQALMQASHLGITLVMWNLDTDDWANPRVSFITRRVFERACNGAVILMHDGEGNRSQTVKALPFIIEGLQARNFQFVTIQQMVDNFRRPPLHSRTYTDVKKE